MPKYYPINEEAARRAKNANSFSDYVPGSATAAYREMVDRAYTLGKQQKGRVDPMYHEKIDGLIDRYARKLAENINQCNLIDARVPSILIAGGSNFPVRKKEKQNAARDKNMGEYMQIEGLLDKVRSTGMGGISADDDRAVEKLENGMAGFLTQPVLSAQAVENLRKARQTLGERAKILVGIMPVVSQRNAIFMENEINGIHVEEDIIQRFAGLDREQGEALGLEVSMQMAREALPYADGFYLMTPFNRVALMERLIARLRTELLDAEG